jgi:hypothetical protein
VLRTRIEVRTSGRDLRHKFARSAHALETSCVGNPKQRGTRICPLCRGSKRSCGKVGGSSFANPKIVQAVAWIIAISRMRSRRGKHPGIGSRTAAVHATKVTSAVVHGVQAAMKASIFQERCIFQDSKRQRPCASSAAAQPPLAQTKWSIFSCRCVPLRLPMHSATVSLCKSSNQLWGLLPLH